MLVATAGQVQAAIYTFDAPADLTDNFFVDVIAGDSLTEWRPGYSAQSGFPASDGGFVHFNQYNSSNSIAFKSGSVFLNSFEISSQYLVEGPASLMQMRRRMIITFGYTTLR